MMAMEAVLFGLVAGVALAAAVSVALRVFVSVNAASRAAVWGLTLCALPFMPVLYLAGHWHRATTTPVAIVAHGSVDGRATAPLQSRPGRISDDREVPVSRSRIHIPIPEHFGEVLVILYAAGASILVFRLLISYVRVRLLRWRTAPAPPELAARLRHWITRCPTSRPVELRLSQKARSPLALGYFKPVIVMPENLALELSVQEYDDLGVHELAHIRRYDDWANLAQRFLEAFLFFHPAAWYAGRKLNLEREIACDDWVVSAHEVKSYARCLTKVLELRQHRGGLLLSSGAFFGKRQIVRRIESLLDRTRNSATGISGVSIACALLIIGAVASQAVHLPAVVAFTQEETGANSSNRWADDSHDLRIKIRGDVTFSDDEQSIASLSPGGFFIMDEAKGWSHRRLEVRAGANGTPEVRYLLDGREKPLDGVGRAWASSHYLFALRELGLDSEARVARILARSGPAGVMEEADRIHSDPVKCEYLSHLLERAKLTSGDLQRVSDGVRKISSDNDKSEFLIAHQQDLLTDKTRNSYFSDVNSIRSDNDRRRVLMHLLDTEGRDAETARLIAISAKSMSSDNDKADVLLAIPAAASGDARCGLLNAARTIQSDNDKARVLRDAGYAESAQCRDAWFSVANQIQSDNDRANVLQDLLKNNGLEAETYRSVAHSAKSINSDNDKANVLVMLSGSYTGDAFFDAADSIQSSNDHARVLQAVLEHKPGKAELLQVIHSALGVSGDNEKADVLLAAAKESHDPEVRSAVQQACEKLNSDSDYRRVASALFNGSAVQASSR
jgi:beta-lactamase regulating signal transducer with metallopeptidase domain